MQAGRRVVVTRYGSDPLDAVEHNLVIEDQPVPTELGPTDVLVEVRSAAVGWVDLLMASGQYQHMPDPPYCPGLEYSGVVRAIGAQVDGLQPGQRVLSDGFRTGPRSSGAHRRWGGFAGWAVAPADAVLPLPERFSFDQGCSLLGSYETAYHCLVACGGLQAGETVLIHGASGCTGLAAVHVAKLVGARVIATGRTAEKLAIVEEEGADHVLATSDGDGVRRFRDDVRALTDGAGVDVVYDPVGGPISVESMRCVTFGARFLIVGWAATPLVAKGKGQRGAPNANQLPTNLIMMKGLKVLGCPTVIGTHRDPGLRPPRLRQIFAWIAEGRLTPRVGPGYPLDEVRDAMRAKWDSRFVGGCILRPWDRGRPAEG